MINEKWLDGVMKSGARILLNLDPAKAEKGTSYFMEIQKLNNDYIFVPTIIDGIECWEAIKK